jgi:hypothetical protein
VSVEMLSGGMERLTAMKIKAEMEITLSKKDE